MACNELRQQMADHVKAAQEILAKADADNKRDLTPDEEKAFTELEAKIDSAKAEIAKAEVRSERAQKARAWQEDMKKSAGRKSPAVLDAERQRAGNDERAPLALQSWFLTQSHRSVDLDDKQREACEALGFDPHAKELLISFADNAAFAAAQRGFAMGGSGDAVTRAMSAISAVSHLTSTITSSGGAVMPAGSLMTSLEANLLAFGGVLQVAGVISSDNRGPITWATMDDTTNKAVRVGEAQSTTQQNPTFAQKIWNLYKYTSAVALPFELLDGSAFGIVPMLGGMFGERLGRKWADDFTTGTGAAQPWGIVPNATTFAAASATAISNDDLDKLIAAVDPAYRTGASFMMHDAIRLQLRLLKDGIGRPLMVDGVNSGEQMSLKGYPLYINQSMDSTMSSGKKTVLFGRLSAHKVRRYGSIRLYRLDQVYKEQDMDNFVVFAEADSNTLSAGTAPFKVLTH